MLFGPSYITAYLFRSRLSMWTSYYSLTKTKHLKPKSFLKLVHNWHPLETKSKFSLEIEREIKLKKLF